MIYPPAAIDERETREKRINRALATGLLNLGRRLNNYGDPYKTFFCNPTEENLARVIEMYSQISPLLYAYIKLNEKRKESNERLSEY